MADSESTPEYPPWIEREIDQFAQSLSKQDVVTPMLLRFHLISENLLERAMIGAMPAGFKLVDSGNLSYAQKLAVVDALGLLSTQLVGSLRALNKSRNSASHSQEADIGLTEIKNIGRPFGARFNSLVRESEGDMPRLLMKTCVLIYTKLFVVIAQVESGGSSAT